MKAWQPNAYNRPNAPGPQHECNDGLVGFRFPHENSLHSSKNNGSPSSIPRLRCSKRGQKYDAHNVTLAARYYRRMHPELRKMTRPAYRAIESQGIEI